MMFYGNTSNQIESEKPILFDEKTKMVLIQKNGQEFKVPIFFSDFASKKISNNQTTIAIETWYLKKNRIIHL